MNRRTKRLLFVLAATVIFAVGYWMGSHMAGDSGVVSTYVTPDVGVSWGRPYITIIDAVVGFEEGDYEPRGVGCDTVIYVYAKEEETDDG